MSSNTRKRLMKSKEARAFLRAHPEFNNFEINSVTSLPYYTPRLNPKRADESQVILENLSKYPSKEVQEVLTAYYDGDSIAEIAARLGITKRRAGKIIFIYKARVMRLIKSGFKINLQGRKRHGELILQHKGKVRRLYKVAVNCELFWVDDTGLLLPEDVQGYLDGDEKFTVKIPDYLT